MTPSQALAELAIGTAGSELPSSALAAARKMSLDSIATAIGGWDADGVDEVLAQLREWGGTPQCTVLVHGDRLPAPNAAFANSLLIHALDYDDLYRPAALHIMCSVLPAALAGAELGNGNGRELLAAVVLGVEVAARLGLAMRHLWRPVQAAGFLPSTIVGGFGATAAAARLLGLSVAQTTHALGIYYAQNAGNRQALYDKTLTKRMQPALAVRSAIWAVQLAARGISGPRRALEGEAGLVRLYAGGDGELRLEDLTGLSGCWQIEQLAIKRFPSCGACHPVTQAALDLIKETALSAGDIEEIEIYLGEGGNAMVGAPFELGDNPQADAQFSAAYGVALALLRGDAGIGRYSDACIRADQAVADLARRVKLVKHLPEPPPRESFSDHEPAWVDQPHMITATTRDGRRLSRIRTIRDVLSPDAAGFGTAAAKLRECAAASSLFPAARGEAIIAAVQALDGEVNLGDLFDLCTRPGR